VTNLNVPFDVFEKNCCGVKSYQSSAAKALSLRIRALFIRGFQLGISRNTASSTSPIYLRPSPLSLLSILNLKKLSLWPVLEEVPLEKATQSLGKAARHAKGGTFDAMKLSLNGIVPSFTRLPCLS
jgi:hypothetical protein